MIPRDDVRIGPKCGEPEPHDLECFETATPEEFAEIATAEGYVKVDVDAVEQWHIKAERLEAELAEVTEHRDNMLQRWVEVDEANNKLRAELANLSAELADTEDEVESLTDWLRETRAELAETQAELADLRASSVVVRRKCETCDGSMVDPYQPDENLVAVCPDCDNGWQLAEGVRLVKFPYEAETTPTFYVIPARLIEGDTPRPISGNFGSPTSDERLQRLADEWNESDE